MISQELKQFNLPDSPGVYYFLGIDKEILYVGKATSLSDRVKSYFSKDILETRGPLIEKMVHEAVSISYKTTDSVLEALILEANEIKKHQPSYNVKDKDNRSFNYVVFTKEDYPRIFLKRGRELTSPQPLSSRKERGKGSGKLYSDIFGPFPHGAELKEALKIIRKIFPYRDEKCRGGVPEGKPAKPCFNAQIGLCPGVCAGWMNKTEYRRRVKYIRLFFEGKKTELIRDMEKEMKLLAKEHKFEEAEQVKRKIYALDHIQDVALIKQQTTDNKQPTMRIEAYDIAHISGKDAVGVMTVIEDSELAKSQYRKFKIKLDKNDDTNNLKEVLNRRLNHTEWPLPNLIAVDGGIGQLNAAREVLKVRGFDIDVVAVTKDARHKAREVLGLTDKSLEKQILLANAEAHRFAIGYHRKLRTKGFRI